MKLEHKVPKDFARDVKTWKSFLKFLSAREKKHISIFDIQVLFILDIT